MTLTLIPTRLHRTLKPSFGPWHVQQRPYSLTLPAPLNTMLDAAVNIPGTSSEAYVFSKTLYARWDFVEDEVISVGNISHSETFEALTDTLGFCVYD